MRFYRFFVSPIDLDKVESIDVAIRQMRVHIAQLETERGKMLLKVIESTQFKLFSDGKEK